MDWMEFGELQIWGFGFGFFTFQFQNLEWRVWNCGFGMMGFWNWTVLSSQNGSGDHWTIAGAASWSCLEAQNGSPRHSQSEGKSSFGYVFSCAKWLWSVQGKIISRISGLELPKWLRRPLNHRRRSVLELFGISKWQPKAPPERRKICIWIRILMCEVALRCLGKDNIKDKRS